MADTFIHIGEMLARNARMYPDEVALIERIPAEKKRGQSGFLKRLVTEITKFL